MKSFKDPILKTSNWRFSKDQSNKKQHMERLWQQGAQWSPNSMHNHNMHDCHKWHADGTSQFTPKKKNYYKTSNVHSKDWDMKACFAQMQKDLKRIPGTGTYLRPSTQQASLYAHDLVWPRELVAVGPCFGKVSILATMSRKSTRRSSSGDIKCQSIEVQWLVGPNPLELNWSSYHSFCT